MVPERVRPLGVRVVVVLHKARAGDVVGVPVVLRQRLRAVQVGGDVDRLRRISPAPGKPLRIRSSARVPWLVRTVGPGKMPLYPAMVVVR